MNVLKDEKEKTNFFFYFIFNAFNIFLSLLNKFYIFYSILKIHIYFYVNLFKILFIYIYGILTVHNQCE